MHTNRKNLPTTDADSDSDLTPGFTYQEMKDDLWSPIDDYYNKTRGNPRFSSDIDIRQIIQRYAEKGSIIGQRQALNIMDSIASKGIFEKIKVWDEISNREISVLRKKKDATP